MSRYILAFLLLSTYSGSHGGSVPILLSNLLSSLVEKCPNVLLKEQISAQLNVCNIYAPPFNDQQFDCMMFVDINKQLCEAVRESNLTLSADSTIKINTDLNVGDACAQAKNWSLTELISLPNYKEKVAKVFNSQIFCVKVCSVAEVTSEEANFFCKYIKWGSEVLSSLFAPTPIKKDENPLKIVANGSENKAQTNHDLPSTIIQHVVKETHTIPIKGEINTSPEVNITSPSALGNKPETAQTHPSVVEQAAVQPDKLLISSSAVEIASQQALKQVSIKDQAPMDIEVKVPSSEKPSVSPSVQASPDVIDKPAGEQDLSEDDVDNNAAIEEQDHKKKKVEKVQVSDGVHDAAEYAEIIKPYKTVEKLFLEDFRKAVSRPREKSSYSKEEGADLEDNSDGEGELDVKPETNQDKKSNQKNFDAIPVAGELETYANAMPDQYANVDDHFLSFFLSAIIMMVLLYVLYHNKNKVSKVVLGLIVEGRQPGRRRNSRGHAYKRLDTLEQAMSTSSTAPPSKIIY